MMSCYGSQCRCRRTMLACVLGLVWIVAWAGLAGSAASASVMLGAEAAALPGTGMKSSVFATRAPVVPSMQWLVAGEQLIDSRQAALDSSRAFVTRWRSRSEFEHLGEARAARVALEQFPAAMGRPEAGTPSLPPGERVARYVRGNVAQLVLPSHKRALIESFGGPMAVKTARGSFAPIDLGLRETAEGFTPAATGALVEIPKRLDRGVTRLAGGVSITPVNVDGRPLSGSPGVKDGASVLYANTQTDTDTVVKPASSGVELAALLRSVVSPSNLYYQVRAPGGAHLMKTATGAVQVSVGKRRVGVVLAPVAVDAAGSPVPVSMSVAGDLVALHVALGAGEHMWPIDVDPFYESVDEELEGGCTHGPGWVEEQDGCTEGHTNWNFYPPSSSPFGDESCYCKKEDGNGYIKWHPYENYNGGEVAGIIYETQGESRIYHFVTTSEGTYSSSAQVHQEILTHGGGEKTNWYNELPSETGHYAATGGICAHYEGPEKCEPSAGTPGNEARFLTVTTASGGAGAFSQEVSKAWLWIAQEKGPELSFNTTSPTIEKAGNRPNVLYGSGSWLGPYSGALEMAAVDHGVGVSRFEANINGYAVGGGWPFFDGDCKGVQCNQTLPVQQTYNSRMPNGEPELEINASDAVGLGTYNVTHKIKVDATPPYNITVSGWPSSREITAAPHMVTVEATDGKAPLPSSGVKSIAVKIDGGQETILPGSSCPLGECTATGKYTISAEGLTEGVHRLVVTATDNAYNAAAKEFTFDVHGANPVTVGPGTVDPITGQLQLSAKDVSLGGISGVSRVYRSRNLTAGANGPLGPQWAISLGNSEGLTALPDGSVALKALNGGVTTFTRETNGEFESPLGDGNLKVEAKEAEPGKGITEYLVKDLTAGSTTRFTQPTGTESTTPIFANQFGNANSPPQTPESNAIDAKGDVWVTDFTNNRVEEYAPTGALLAAYGTGATGYRQFNGPWGIAINRTTGDVYVTDQGKNRVEELGPEGTFIAAFGWGVSDGQNAFEICRAECRSGIAGSGAGQFNIEAGIAVDANGNIWVADYGNNRIQEFDKEGHYLQTIGGGSGSVQFQGPLNIAPVGNELYVTNYTSDTIEEVSTAGKLERQWGHQGQGNGEFEHPRGIGADPRTGNLYVTDAGNNRIQEFNSSGGLIAKFGTAGSAAGQLSEPTGVAVNASGAIYVTDYNNARVEEWMRSSWLPTISEGTLTTSGTTADSYAPVEVEEGKTVILPTETSAPAPVGVTCGAKPTELKKGCRALLFEYANKTLSSLGEAPGEWGEYRGRLMTILFAAYNPATGKMEEKAVAKYAYDKQGRLRAEWDPRIEPSLKTTYGYDNTGHVVAVSPPGQEPWILRYGALDGDPNTGRLLSATRPAAASPTTVREQAEMPAPRDESLPKLSSATPEIGVTLTTSSGVWSSKPLAYSYQWEDCEANYTESRGCTPIMGAVNESYTPQTSDVGYKLVVQMTAENAAGTQTTASSASGAVPSTPSQPGNPAPAPPSVGTSSVYTLAYRVPLAGEHLPTMSKEELAKWDQTKDLPVEGMGMAIFPPDKPMGWPAKSYERATTTYLDEEGRTVNVATPSGAITTTEYNELNQVVRTLSGDNRATALASGKTTEETAAAAADLDTKRTYHLNSQLAETLGPEHKVRPEHPKKATEEVEAREHVVYSYDEGAPSEVYDLVTKTVAGARKATNGEEFDKRTTVTSYNGQNGLGWTLRKPTSVTIDPGGLGLTTTTRYDKTTGDVIETIPPGNARTLLPTYSTQFGKHGTGSGEVNDPSAVAVDSNGNVWVADVGDNRIDEFSSGGTFTRALGWGVHSGTDVLEECTTGCRAGVAGGKGQLSNPQGITYDPVNGDVYLSTGNDQILQFSNLSTGKLKVKAYGKEGAGKVQFSNPQGLTTAANGDIWVADKANHRLEEITDKGKYVAVAGVGKGEYSDVTLCDGKLYAADYADQRIDEVGTEDTETILSTFGKEGKENGQFMQIAGLACDPRGELYATDAHGDRVDVFTSSGAFVDAFGSEGNEPGELNTPVGIAIASSGTVYVADSGNNRIPEWTDNGPNGTGTHGVRTVYYTAEGESEIPVCRNHPEWADMACQTEPLTKTETSGLPELPVTSYTYNLWDEITDTSENFPANKKFHAVTREKVQTYDPADRAETSETKSTPATDTSLPKVTNRYNSATGALEIQATTINGETKSIDNTVGQLEKYTDAAGNTTSYEYEQGGDARLTGIEDGKGAQSYAYNANTGDLEKLVDSAAGTFTATYDPEGKMLTETYPNNMIAKYAHNAVGATTGIEYIKNSHCATKCPEKWFTDTNVLSIHGETLEQMSTLAKENYTYDTAGRLAETNETPTGKNCMTRLYTYDEESNRTSLTTRQSNSDACATEGGETEDHAYDPANRLDDPSIGYEEFGDTTKLPATDAGGHSLTTGYYVDGQVLSQTQNEETVNYRYDAAGRTLETTATGKTKAITVSHYPGPGEAVSWTSEGGEAWTRNIPGIDGMLGAIETSTGVVTLQLHDLDGDIIATASDSETESKLLTTYNSTEFGVPSEGKAPPKYAWLGGVGVASEPSFESGVATKDGMSYVPQIALNLQTAPVTPPGAFPDGSGPGSPYVATISAATLASAEAEGKQTFAEVEAARQKALEEEEKLATEGTDDPEGLATFKTTEEIYAELIKESNWDELISTIIRWAPNKIISELGGKSAEAISHTLKGYAEALKANCLGSYRKNYPWSACWIDVTTFGFSIGPISWYVIIFVSGEPCFRETGEDTPYFECPVRGVRDNPWLEWNN
jgi:YD repeat-containing protein